MVEHLRSQFDIVGIINMLFSACTRKRKTLLKATKGLAVLNRATMKLFSLNYIYVLERPSKTPDLGESLTHLETVLHGCFRSSLTELQLYYKQEWTKESKEKQTFARECNCKASTLQSFISSVEPCGPKVYKKPQNSTALVLLYTFKMPAITWSNELWSMFMNKHKEKLSVLSQPGYYAINVNVHEGGGVKMGTMLSLERKIQLCHSIVFTE